MSRLSEKIIIDYSVRLQRTFIITWMNADIFWLVNSVLFLDNLYQSKNYRNIVSITHFQIHILEKRIVKKGLLPWKKLSKPSHWSSCFSWSLLFENVWFVAPKSNYFSYSVFHTLLRCVIFFACVCYESAKR